MSPNLVSARTFNDNWRNGADYAKSISRTTYRGGGQVRVNTVSYQLLVNNRNDVLITRTNSDFGARGKGYRKENKRVRRNDKFRTFQIWKKAKNQVLSLRWILDYPGRDPKRVRTRTLKR